MTAHAVHVVVPDGIDDPARPSGGNVYDRRLCDGLDRARLVGARARGRRAGGRTRLPPTAGAGAGGSPPSRTARSCSSTAWSRPASRTSWCRTPARLRLVVLVHLPLGAAASASRRSRRRRSVGRSGRRCPRPRPSSPPARGRGSGCWTPTACPPRRVHVAVPGVDGAPLAAGSDDGAALLCVAAVTPDKGHDVLLDALAATGDLAWRLTCVGSLDVDPGVRRAGGRAGQGRRARRPRHLHRPAHRRRPGARRTRTATCSSCRRAARRTGWSSPRRSRAGCRSWRATSAACRRRSVVRDAAATGPACSCRPATPPPSRAPCAAGSRTPASGAGGGRPPAERRRTLPGWHDTAVQVATILGRLGG